MPKPNTPDTPSKVARKDGFLGRLRKDESGNALAIMTAAIFPLAGLVGGAVDMSRMYLVKSRLQQACDAGVLAGRRVMTGASVVADPNAMQQAQNFFNINLAQGAYGAEIGAFTVTDVREGGVATGNVTGRVAGTATATVPMTLMRIFGNDETMMTATCEANLNIANNDIMFVLDLTGSMGCAPPGGCDTSNRGPNSAGNFFVTEVGGSRIQALRDSVSRFFTTINSATPPTARLRVGFVPYSSNVNVGGVLPMAALTSSHQYRSREAFYNTSQHTPSSTTSLVNQTFGAVINTNNCDRYGNNQSFTQGGSSFTPSSPAASTTQPPTATTTGGATPATETRTYYRKVSWTGSGTNRTCVREVRRVVTTWSTRYLFTSWRPGLITYDTSQYRNPANTVMLARGTDGSVAAPGYYNALRLAAVATGATLTASRWDGCIEEREANADIDLPATDEATRWRPAWRDVTFSNTTNNDQPDPLRYDRHYSCTRGAQQLATRTQAEVDAYVANATTNAASRFLAHGFTYHDIGMIWGTRLMSLNGIDSANVAAVAPNGRDVRRHIIFMTDGEMNPELPTYGPYGTENLDRRIVGTSALTDANLTNLHNQRFLAACQAAKDRETSVWVVAFGQALTPLLTACADSNQAFQASSAAELDSMFQRIAQQIAELRLSE